MPSACTVLFKENDFQKRTNFFFLLCIPVRLALSGVVFLFFEDAAWPFAGLFLLVAILFGRQARGQQPQSRGGFQGLVWWRRDVHALLFLLAFVVVAAGELWDGPVVHCVVAVLVGDVLFGVVRRCRVDTNKDGDVVDHEVAAAVSSASPSLRF